MDNAGPAQALGSALHDLPGGQHRLGAARVQHRDRPEDAAGQGPQRARRPQGRADPLHAGDLVSRRRRAQVRLPVPVVRQLRQERLRDRRSVLLQPRAELRPDADALPALAPRLRPRHGLPLPDRTQPRQVRHGLPAGRRPRQQRPPPVDARAPDRFHRSPAARCRPRGRERQPLFRGFRPRPGRHQHHLPRSPGAALLARRWLATRRPRAGLPGDRRHGRPARPALLAPAAGRTSRACGRCRPDSRPRSTPKPSGSSAKPASPGCAPTPCRASRGGCAGPAITSSRARPGASPATSSRTPRRPPTTRRIARRRSSRSTAASCSSASPASGTSSCTRWSRGCATRGSPSATRTTCRCSTRRCRT